MAETDYINGNIIIPNLDLKRDPVTTTINEKLGLIAASYGDENTERANYLAAQIIGIGSFSILYKDSEASVEDEVPANIFQRFSESFNDTISLFDISKYVSSGIENTTIYKAAAVYFDTFQQQLDASGISGVDFAAGSQKIGPEAAAHIAHIIAREEAAIGERIAPKPVAPPLKELNWLDHLKIFFKAAVNYFDSANTLTFSELQEQYAQVRLEELNPNQEPEIPFDQKMANALATRIALRDRLLDPEIISEIREKTGLEYPQNFAQGFARAVTGVAGDVNNPRLVMSTALINDPTDPEFNRQLHARYAQENPNLPATFAKNLEKSGLSEMTVGATGLGLAVVGTKAATVVAKPAIGVTKSAIKLTTGIGTKASIFSKALKTTTSLGILTYFAGDTIYDMTYGQQIADYISLHPDETISPDQHNQLEIIGKMMLVDPFTLVSETGIAATSKLNELDDDTLRLAAKIFKIDVQDILEKRDVFLNAQKDIDAAEELIENNTVTRADWQNFAAGRVPMQVKVDHAGYSGIELAINNYFETSGSPSESYSSAINQLKQLYNNELNELRASMAYAQYKLDPNNKNVWGGVDYNNLESFLATFEVKEYPNEFAHLESFEAYLAHQNALIENYHSAKRDYENAQAFKARENNQYGKPKDPAEQKADQLAVIEAQEKLVHAEKAISAINVSEIESGYQTVVHTLIETSPEVRGPAYETLRIQSLMNGQTNQQWQASLVRTRAALAPSTQPLSKWRDTRDRTSISRLTGYEFSVEDGQKGLTYIPIADDQAHERFEQRRHAEEVLLTQFALYEEQVVQQFVPAQFESAFMLRGTGDTKQASAELSLEQLRLAVLRTKDGHDTATNNDAFIKWLSINNKLEVFEASLTTAIRAEIGVLGDPNFETLTLQDVSEARFDKYRDALSISGNLASTNVQATAVREIVEEYLTHINTSAERQSWAKEYNTSAARFLDTLIALSPYGHTEEAQSATVAAIQEMFILAAEGIDINQIHPSQRKLVESARKAKASYEKLYNGVDASNLSMIIAPEQLAFFTDPKNGFYPYFQEYVRQSGIPELIQQEILQTPYLRNEKSILAQQISNESLLFAATLASFKAKLAGVVVSNQSYPTHLETAGTKVGNISLISSEASDAQNHAPATVPGGMSVMEVSVGF